jgi:CBS domain containing-hemolysin-like protein
MQTEQFPVLADMAMTDTKDFSGTRPEAPDTGAAGWVGRLKARLGFQETSAVRETLERVLSAESAGGKVLAPQQRDMLLRILRFGELRVADVMVPRADINAIDEQAPLSELVQVFEQAGHSRIPLFHETLDDLRGMVHIKDLVSWLVDQSRTQPIPQAAAAHAPDTMHFAGIDLTKANLGTKIAATRIRRPVLFVPPSMPALNLLLRMQSTHIHLAMVVDEYGGTDGLVSIEDLVEEIVGDIEDEHDDDDDLIQPDGPDALIASGRAPITEVEERLGMQLVAENGEATDVDTLAGLVAALLGRVPVRGELIHQPNGIEFEILDADPRRIKKLRLRRPAQHSAPTEPPPGPRKE